MKKILAFVLAAMMLLSMAACGQSNNGSSDETTTAPTTETEATLSAEITYFSLSYTQGDKNRNLSAYEEGGVLSVDFNGEFIKRGTIELSALETIASALANSGLVALNGTDEWADGPDYASMYITLSDDTMISANYSGKIPQVFLDGYAKMENVFKTLTEDIPVYVSKPVVMEGVDANIQAELEAILNASGLQPLDSFAISALALDEYFAQSAGLSSANGITAAGQAGPMMLAQAYSIVIVTLEDAANAATVAADFEANMAWNKWVCVQASNGLIAQKGNMVLCLMGNDSAYTDTAAAILSNGWTQLSAPTNG